MFRWKIVDWKEFDYSELINFSDEQKQKLENLKRIHKETKARIKMIKFEIFEFIKWSYEYEWIKKDIFIFWNKLYVSSEPTTVIWKTAYWIAKTTLLAIDVWKELFKSFKKNKK